MEPNQMNEVQTSVPSPKPQKSQSRFLRPLLIALGLIIVAGVACVAWQNYTSTPSQSNNVSSAISADWKTYRNNKYGFELNIPNTYSVNDEVDYTDSESREKGGISESYKPNDLMFVMHVFPEPYKRFTIDFKIKKSEYDSIDSWYSAWKVDAENPVPYEGFTISMDIKEVSDVYIDGVKAKIITTSGLFPFPRSMFVAQKNGLLYWFSYAFTGESNIQEGELSLAEREKLFKDIVSTLNFIEPTVDTSSWQTYRNEKYGFEFKYPAELIIDRESDNEVWFLKFQYEPYVMAVKFREVNGDTIYNYGTESIEYYFKEFPSFLSSESITVDGYPATQGTFCTGDGTMADDCNDKDDRQYETFILQDKIVILLIISIPEAQSVLSTFKFTK